MIIGAGFVGLATAVARCLQGDRVYLVERDASRVEMLREGVLPFHEPGLDVAFRKALDERLTVLHIGDKVNDLAIDLTLVCVGTPFGTERGVYQDQTALRQAVRWWAAHIAQPPDDVDLVIKSTIQPGTCAQLTEIVIDAEGVTPRIHHIPEFLAEGTALRDALEPSRVVIGAVDEEGNTALALVRYAQTYYAKAECLWMDVRSAELCKLASNLALALRVSMANELAALADAWGGNAADVLEAVGHDPRVGKHFLRPGLGWGGSCFPKDLATIAGMGSTLASAAIEVNNQTINAWVRAITRIDSRRNQPMRVCVLGQAFKPGTSDMRESPGVRLCNALSAHGFAVRSHDPVAAHSGEGAPHWEHYVGIENLGTAVAGCDVLVLATEWPAYEDKLGLLAQYVTREHDEPILFDARSLWCMYDATAHGFLYTDRPGQSPA